MKRYFRLVYSSFSYGRLYRGPRAEIVVAAEDMEAAMRDVRRDNRLEVRGRTGIPGTTTFYKVEETDKAALAENYRDIGWALDTAFNGQDSGERTAVAFEAKVAAKRRARKLATMKVVQR